MDLSSTEEQDLTSAIGSAAHEIIHRNAFKLFTWMLQNIIAENNDNEQLAQEDKLLNYCSFIHIFIH